MHATIQPVSVGWPTFQATVLRVTVVLVNRIGLDGSADVRWSLSSEQGGSFEGANTLAGAAYDAWGNDDEYLLRWLAEPAQLGLTIVEIVPDAPPAPEPTSEPAPVDAPATVEEPV
jgi:hypothetical protein